jgi:DNA helicase-2/ATP-dependent DNA helicase PcrA
MTTPAPATATATAPARAGSVEQRPVALTGEQVAALMGIPFSAEQRAAITAPPERAVQIVAGAGSGKTAVMAARVVWLVGSGYVRPDQVLGLTFTNKAAGELATRVRGALAQLGVALDLEGGEPTVATYHAYAGGLVREHGLRIGVEPDARLLADAVRFQLAGSVVRRCATPLPALHNALSVTVAALVSLESECSDHLAEPGAARLWLQELADDLEIRAGAAKGKTAADELRACAETARRNADLCLLALAYRQAKRQRGAVDFGDQIGLAVQVATTCTEVVAAERGRFRAVLLDEYQDTSVAQRVLLVALFGDGAGVTSVGDPFQAIYGFRGASVDNLDRFGEHFGGAARRSLRTSQRSGGRLLTLANRVASALSAVHTVEELLPRSDRVDVGEVVVSRHERFAQELEWVAGQVQAALEGGTAPGQVAVLLRRWANVGAVHAALVAAGVPVEVVGLGGLVALPEVADVVAVLTLLDDPTANADLLRLLAGPRFRLGRRDLQEVGRRAARMTRGEGDLGDVDPLEEAASGVDPCDLVALADVLDDPGTRVSTAAAHRLRALGTELRALRRHTGEPLPDLVARVVATTGLEVEVAASPSAVAARRHESLGAFTDVVASYADLDGEASLHSFLAYLRAADEFERGFDSALPADTDAVQLMTVHKSKGLEWDVVVLPDLTRGTFPSERSTRWISTYGALPHPLRSDAGSTPAGGVVDWQDVAGYKTSCGEHLRLEEDRLAYVAMTRARHTIIASSSVWGPTQKDPRQPSPYLELLREHAEAGGGTVTGWEETPPKGEQNPYLAAAARSWPVAPGGPAHERLLEAAAAVRAAGGQQTAPAVVLSRDEQARFEELDAEAEALLVEARANRVHRIEVPLPAALTASQVLALRRDPDALARSLARPMPSRPVAAARRGTAFHTWVEERFAVAPLLEPDDLPGSADVGVDDSELAALQEAFLASEWADRPPHAVETPFAVLLGGRLIRGRIDAVFDLGGGRWLVVDWKTGAEPADPVQLAIYRVAWAERVGVAETDVERDVEAAFLAVRTGVLDRPPLLTRAELDTLLR